MSNSDKQTVQKLFSSADIKINGNRPWDINIHNDRFFRKFLAGGSLALGESYMDGWWDCQVLDQFFYRAMKAGLWGKVSGDMSILLSMIKARVLNPQTISRARKVGEQHYDIGNELYRRMLDKRMVYSCGYWKNANTLDEAQEAKLDLTCRKLGIKKGERVLDIGCGWGGFAQFAAERYRASVLGVTISKDQAQLARERCAGFDVQIELQDYREVQGKFDKIVSIGMFEHVGSRNYITYMETVHRLLLDNGLTMIHTIGRDTSARHGEGDPWVRKYIFPNSQLPSLRQITKAAEGLFVVEDIHNFGADYDKTSLAWQRNFEGAWPELKNEYSERFHRMWNYYLFGGAAACRARKIQLWQIVMSKEGVEGGYKSIR